MTKLKPCPFCGVDDAYITEPGCYNLRQVECGWRGTSSMLGDTDEEAIKFWNDRPSPWKTFEEEQPPLNIQVFTKLHDNAYVVGSFHEEYNEDGIYVTFHTNFGKYNRSLKNIKWMPIPE